MTKTLLGVVALVLVVAGGWYAYGHYTPKAADTAQTMGTYAYTCDTGTRFDMTPSADLSEVTLVGKDSAPFSTVTLYKMGDGNVYEDPNGDSEISFSGAGEKVLIVLGAQTMNCQPVASSDMAPFNWGDVQ